MFGINWLDAVIILLLAVGLGIGYSQGLLRQVINLAALYIGSILAVQYYHVLGKFLEGMFSTTPGLLMNAIAFFIILLITAGILNFLAHDAYRVQLHILPTLNQFSGMLLGLAAMWIIVTLAVNMLTFATSVPNWASAEDARQFIQQGLTDSVLVGVTRETFPTLITALKPWLPTGVPAIFSL